MLKVLFAMLLNLFKLMIDSAFTQDKLLIKVVISICLIGIIFMYRKHKDPVLNTAQEIINKYKLKNKILSFVIIITYAGLAILGIFLLRMANRNRAVDLREIYSIIITNSFFVNLINGILGILILIVYIILLLNIFKYIKIHIIRLHLYYNTKESYYEVTWMRFVLKYTYLGNLFKVRNAIFYKKLFGFSISYHVIAITRILHYIILINAFIYDLIYNNYTIHVIFYLLPYLFLYQIYIKICDFYINKQPVNDVVLHDIIYAEYMLTSNETPFAKDDELLINGRYYEKQDVHDLIFIYLQYGLDNYVYEFVVDKFIGLRYNYILDWKFRNTTYR